MFTEATFEIEVLDSVEPTLSGDVDTNTPSDDKAQIVAKFDGLGASDDLDASGGLDEMMIFGSGDIDPNDLANCADFELVRLVSLNGGSTNLTIRNGSTASVNASGNGNNTIPLRNQTKVDSIAGSDGCDMVNQFDDVQVGSVSLGLGNNTANASGNAQVASIDLSGAGSGERVNLSGNAAVGSLDFGSISNGAFHHVTQSGRVVRVTVTYTETNSFVSVRLLGSAQLGAIDASGGTNVEVDSATVWNPLSTFNGSSMSDHLRCDVTGGTFDLGSV